MKRNQRFTCLIALLSITVFASSCNSSGKSKEEAFDPTGKWEYKVTTDVSYGVIDIEGKPGAYKAKMTTEVFGTLELMNLEIQGSQLTADLDVGGTPAKIKCDFDGDKITGAVTAGEDKFPFIGEKSN